MPKYIDADILKQQDFQDFSNTDVMNAIDRCPTVEAEPVKRGEWIQKFESYRSGEENEVDEIPYIVCSKCLHKEWHYDTENTDVSPPNYCPNCGADMMRKDDWL